MAMLITKIGADTVELRSEVTKLPYVVKNSFDKMKQASEGGIVENVKGIKKGFGDIKDVLVGGGIVTAVLGFYRMSQEEAKKAADAGSVLAQNAVALGEKFSGLKSVVAGAGAGFFGFVNMTIDGVYNGLANIGALFKGQLGDVQATRDAVDATAKGVRDQERALAEAKKHSAEFNKLNQEAKQLTEARAEAEMKSLSLEEQRAILTQKLLEAQRAEQEAGDTGLARRVAQVEQLKIGNQLMEVQKGLDEASSKEREKIAKIRDDERKAILASLDADQRAAVIRDEVLMLESLLQQASLSQETSERTRITLAERRKELIDAENKAAEERAKIEEKNAEAIFQSQQKQADATRENLTLQERKKKIYDELRALEQDIARGMAEGLDISKDQQRVDTLRGQLREIEKQENINNVEIAKLLLKGEENLTDQEKLRLQILQGVVQQRKIDAEIQLLLAKGVKNLTPAERERLSVLTGQSQQISKQLSDMEQINEKVRTFIKLTRSGREAEDQSTISLEGALRRAKSQLDELERDNSYRTAFSPNGKNPLYYTLLQEVTKMENELRMRRGVSDYASRFGEDATRYKFGDTVTDRALRDMKDTNEKMQKDIERLTISVTKAPLFRKSSPVQ